MDPRQEPAVDLNTISRLVPAAQEGSESAQAELLTHIQDYVRLMAQRRLTPDLRAKVDPSDIVQQSLAQVIRGFEQFRGTGSRDFYGWLKVIVANEVRRTQRDFHREKRDINREKRLAHVEGSHTGVIPRDLSPTPGTKAIAAEQVARLRTTLASLPKDYAEVIRLRSLEGLPFKEVAEIMKRTHDSTTKLWYRAVLKLQQQLESEGNKDDSA